MLMLLLAVTACGGNGRRPEVSPTRSFPKATAPLMYRSGPDAAEYVLAHYWDEFFSGKGICDSTHILGVENSELETQLSTFICALDNLPPEKAQICVRNLFNGIVRAHLADSTAGIYDLMTRKVARYMYDPNSPVRDEEYYLPFVSAMAACPLTAEEMRPSYEYEARSCAICRRGTVAPDFRVRTITGKTFSLHSLKADYLMLFFSNPGCKACKDIIDRVQSDDCLRNLIREGRLAVVNVYIDRELDEWRAYEHNYPSTWHTGYDLSYVIRGERLYDVRAIPSLYLLDSGKKIIFKDAPVERVTGYLNRITR